MPHKPRIEKRQWPETWIRDTAHLDNEVKDALLTGHGSIYQATRTGATFVLINGGMHEFHW